MTFQPSKALEFAQTPEGLEKIHKLVSQGKTLKEVAQALGTTLNTLYVWRKKYPEIDQVLSSSKKIADELVEQSLYESCFGRTEREITLEKDGEGNITKQVVKTKYIPPNVQAIQFWLSNRRTYGNHHAQRFPHQQEPVSHSSMIFRILLRIRRRTRQMNGMID